MAEVACPLCHLIFKSDEDKPRCPSCGWNGTWKPEPEEQSSREIKFSFDQEIH